MLRIRAYIASVGRSFQGHERGFRFSGPAITQLRTQFICHFLPTLEKDASESVPEGLASFLIWVEPQSWNAHY